MEQIVNKDYVSKLRVNQFGATASLADTEARSDVKPVFSFGEYELLTLGADGGVVKFFGKDSELLTADQLAEVNAYFAAIKVDEVYTKAMVEMTHAKKFLADTDWVEAKFVRDVLREKVITEEDFNAKYSEVLSNRKKAIEVSSQSQAVLQQYTVA